MFQTHTGGGRWWESGRKASQPHPQPLPIGRGVAAHSKCATMQENVVFYAGKRCFLYRKTAFSTQENAVFTVVNRFGVNHLMSLRSLLPLHALLPHSLCAAAPLPFGEGLGVGLRLCCHSPTICHHRYMSETQWFRKIGGRVAANFVKKFFSSCKADCGENVLSLRAGPIASPPRHDGREWLAPCCPRRGCHRAGCY